MSKYSKNNKKGSVLVFSIFVMMISLIIGVSLMSTVAIQRKSTLSTAKSVNSFQVADSGLEYVFWKVREYRADHGGDLQNTPAFEIRDIFSECSGGGVVEGNINEGSYEIYFYQTPGATTALPCSSRMVNVQKVKSVGTFNGITRSMEADINFSTL
ncbi:MAG: pilus assembly PilX N-terminal domain-containing protein [Candidatus Moraniibacteriota bacterium]